MPSGVLRGFGGARQLCRDERNNLLKFSRRVKAMLSDRLSGFVCAFHADGRGGCSFAAGGAVLRAARSILGADYNFGDHPIIAGAALFVSWQRFVGTVVGALVGATAASYFGPHVLVFGICVFILGCFAP